MDRESRYQLGYSNDHAEAMYDDSLRRQKARKILVVIQDYARRLGRTTSEMSLLDVGCSTGFFADTGSSEFRRVVGIDIDEGAVAHAQERFATKKVSFQVADSMAMPFDNASFDIVSCSQIYEHVPDPKRLLDEIYRLLRPGGYCYFAAGNRMVLMEPHYRLPFLSLPPKPIAHLYLRLTGKGSHYYENHLFVGELRKLVAAFGWVDYTRRIIEDPLTFYATEMIHPGSLKQKLALATLDLAYWLCPTYVWILTKPEDVPQG
jgi:ubiquinone/menaquinone biosynthesis C-methylase UbiE